MDASTRTVHTDGLFNWVDLQIRSSSDNIVWGDPQFVKAGAKSATLAATSASESRSSSARPIDPKKLDPAQIKSCLDEHEGSIELSWRALGLSSRHVLVRLLKKHGLRAR